MARQTMDVSEAAEFLHYSKRTVYNKCARRELPHFKVGNTLLFYADELEEMLESMRVPTNADFARLADMKLLELDMERRIRRLA